MYTIGGCMEKETLKLNVSEARRKLTQLDKILSPGETLEITRNGKTYARIELVRDMDPYEEILKSIDSLPESDDQRQSVARNYKKILYGMRDEDSNGI